MNWAFSQVLLFWLLLLFSSHHLLSLTFPPFDNTITIVILNLHQQPPNILIQLLSFNAFGGSSGQLLREAIVEKQCRYIMADSDPWD